MKMKCGAYLARAVALATAAIIFILPPENAQAQAINDSLLRINVGFEDRTIGSKFVQSGNLPEPSQLQKRAGSWALRSFLDRATSPVSYRTEVHVPGKQNIGEVYWAGISIYFPETHVKSGVWEIVFQLHDTPNDWNNVPPGRQPVFSVMSNEGIGGKFTLLGFYNSTYNGGGDTKQIAFNTRVGTIKVGWNDFVFNWRWAHSAGQGGFSKVWIDGQPVLDYNGPNTFNDNNGPYTKFGLYKGWHDRNSPADLVSSRLVYHDEYREAGSNGSYEMVAPRGSQPVVPSLVRPNPPVLGAN